MHAFILAAAENGDGLAEFGALIGFAIVAYAVVCFLFPIICLFYLSQIRKAVISAARRQTRTNELLEVVCTRLQDINEEQKA